MYICAYIPIHAHTYMSMYKYTRTHLHILLWPGKEGSAYHIDHWLQNLLHRLRLKHCTHLSDPEISIKAWRRSHRDHRWWLVRNKKSCAWQYVPPGWFEECDHGVSECQSLYDSDTVKSSKLKNVRRKLNILLLRRHLYTIQCHMTTLWYRSWLLWQF